MYLSLCNQCAFGIYAVQRTFDPFSIHPAAVVPNHLKPYRTCSDLVPNHWERLQNLFRTPFDHRKPLQMHSRPVLRAFQMHSKSTPDHSQCTPRPPQEHSESIPRAFQKYSKSIPRAFQKHSKNIPKAFQAPVLKHPPV